MSDFQNQVDYWMLHTFGLEIAKDEQERGWRFMEEALELVQATGVTKADVLKLVEYTFDRKVGTIEEEVGGVRVTLSALCNAFHADEDKCADAELYGKCWPNAAAIRAKQATKPLNNSPLPQKVRGSKTNSRAIRKNPLSHCAMQMCGSLKPGDTIAVNEITGDGSYRTHICIECAGVLGLQTGDDIPHDAVKCNRKLKAHYVDAIKGNF